MLKDLCFEIIQTCPNNCLFCSSCSSIDKDNQINIDMFKKVISHFINEGGIEEISISGGEPFLHPNLYEMIKYCKDNNIRTVLFTSGIKKRIKLSPEEYKDVVKQIETKYKSYIKEGMSLEEIKKYIKKEIGIIDYYNNQNFDCISRNELEYLKEIGLDKIVFDFQAWNPEIYNEIMNTKEFHTLVTSSIIKAYSAGINTDAHFIPTKINYKELPEIIEMLNIVDFNSLSILNFVPQGRGYENASKLMLDDNEMQEFINIYNNCKNDFKGNIRIGIPLISDDKHKCTAGLDKLVIKYDGTVLPCPAFKEYDIKELEKAGIRINNIYDNLDNIKVYNGSRVKPLCKQIYKFNKYIK